MKSPVVKRSIILAGRKTSVSLEDAFWTGLKGDRERSRHIGITMSDWPARSMRNAYKAISHRRFGFLCSITIAPGYATWKPATAFMKCCLIPRVCTPEP